MNEFFLPPDIPSGSGPSRQDPLLMDRVWMREAIKLARQAAAEDEVPVGAVIVHKDRLLGRAHNQVETLRDPTAHAEMIAITQAAGSLGSKWLHDCTLYVTLEPCSMCAGAIVLSRLARLVFAAPDPKTGACGSLADIVRDRRLNHRVEVSSGLMMEESAELLREFFAAKRVSRADPDTGSPTSGTG